MTDDKLILVTGATGKTARGAIGLLLERGHRVRAMVHRDDERSRALAEAGAEVIQADFLDLDGVAAAAQGVDSAYFCYPIRPGLIEATATFAQAATEAGVGSVVNMSQISARREAGSNAARQHWLAERLLDRTDLLTTHLRPTFFAEWLTSWWELRGDEGRLRLPFGEGRHAPIAAADQSRVIAALLADPKPHAGATYTLHGPLEMDHHQIAAAMAATLGIPVRYEPISVEEFTAAMTRRGLPSTSSSTSPTSPSTTRTASSQARTTSPRGSADSARCRSSNSSSTTSRHSTPAAPTSSRHRRNQRRRSRHAPPPCRLRSAAAPIPCFGTKKPPITASTVRHIPGAR